MAIKPQTIGFGEAYSDGSGWEWRVDLSRQPDGQWVVEGDGVFSGLCKPGRDLCWREVAAAFDAIADELGEDERGA